MSEPPESGAPSWRPLRVLAVGAVVVVALLLLRYQLPAIALVFSGVLLGLAIKATSRWIADHTGAPYRVVVGALAVLLVAATGLVLWYLGASIVDQSHHLAEQLPRIARGLFDRVMRDSRLRSIVGVVPPTSGARAAAAAPVAPARIVSGAAVAMRQAGEVAGAIAIVFFLGIYGALDPAGCVRPIVALTPPRRRARVAAVLDEVGANLTRWMLGRLVAMAFVGVVTTIGLMALKVPLAGLLGLVAGLATFVEYLGAVVSALPPLALALSLGPTAAAGVVGLFTVTHVIEGYILTPYLARSMVRIPPAHSLAIQVIAGSLFGVIGLTFATPLLVVVVIAVRRLYVEDVLGDAPASGADR